MNVRIRLRLHISIGIAGAFLFGGKMILLFLIIFKFILFYNLTHVSYSPLVVLSVDVFIFSCFYLIRNTKLKGTKALYFGLYVFLSIVMFADATYFSYFNRLPVIKEMGHAGNLGDVKGAVLMLLNIKNLLFIIDLPLVIYLAIKRKLNFIDEFLVQKLNLRRIIIPTFFVLVTGIVLLANLSKLSSVKKLSLFSYHTLDIFGKLEDENSEIDVSKENFISDDEKNEFTGIAKGKNFIMIQVESLNNFPIGRKYEGEEITPNLNRLIKEKGTIYANDYFELLGAGNTSDAEFVSLHSMYPSMKNPSYEVYLDSYLYGLPKIFKDFGYDVAAYHGYKRDFWIRDRAYPHIGIDKFYAEDNFDLSDKIGMGLSDKSFFKQSAEIMKSSQKQPFFSFLVTLTSHVPYEMPGETKKIKIKKEDEGSIFGNYLNAVRYTDEAIGEFIEELKEKGLYDNSVIALYGDHHGILMNNPDDNRRVGNFVGKKFDFDTMLNIPLIIHIGGYDGTKTVEGVRSQLDFAPTILNLFGISKKNYVMMGTDILSAKNPGVVFPQSYLIRGSFINDDYIFQMKRDGIFENGELRSRKTGEVVDHEKARELYKRALKEIDYSKYVLENNLLESMLKEGNTDENHEVKTNVSVRNAAEIKNKAEFESAFKKGFRTFRLGLFKSTDNFYTTSKESGDLKELKTANPDLMTLGDLVRGYDEDVSFIIDAENTREIADYIRKMPGLYKNLILAVRNLEDYEYVSVRQNGYRIMIAGNEIDENMKVSMYENNTEIIFENANDEKLKEHTYFMDKEPKIYSIEEVDKFENKSDEPKEAKIQKINFEDENSENYFKKIVANYNYETESIEIDDDELKTIEDLKNYMSDEKVKVAFESTDQAVHNLRTLKEQNFPLERIVAILNSYDEAQYVYKLGFSGISFSDKMNGEEILEAVKLVGGFLSE